MAKLHRDPGLARAMGMRAQERAAGVTWDRVCRTLLDGLDQ
jgi:hypothetical protein